MNGWTDGYVADIAYMAGYYPPQSPHHLAVACLLGNMAPPDLSEGAALTYLELGCGQGFGALVLAASNPQWRIFALDFNPSHIAGAQAMAREAGLANIRFLEADLADVAATTAVLPEVDIVSLHGVWSWVSPAVRAGIVGLLRARLRTGGIAQVSYNALPAWQGAIGMQRLLREAGQRSPGHSDRQARAGAALLGEAMAAGALHIATSPLAAALLKKIDDMPPAYLAHEFMNAHWSPAFHADVAADLAAAKLDFVASANLLENFRELTLSEAQRALLDRLDDPAMVELLKDMCLERALRNDVFVRGGVRLDPARRNAALGEVVLALRGQPARFRYETDVPVGQAAMAPEFYRPIVEALGQRPHAVRDLLALPGLRGRRDNPAELVGMLIGSGQAIPVAARAVSANAGDAAADRRFNTLTLRRLVRPDQLNVGLALADSRLGNGISLRALHVFMHVRLQESGGRAMPARWAEELLPQADGEERARLAALLEREIEEADPLWRLRRDIGH